MMKFTILITNEHKFFDSKMNFTANTYIVIQRDVSMRMISVRGINSHKFSKRPPYS